MYSLKAELLLGEISGAPLSMRPNLQGMGQDSFLAMMLLQKPTTHPDALYLHVCLFERDGKYVKELSNPNYERKRVQRNIKGWKPFKGKEGSMVMMNQHPIMFPRFNKVTLVNYAGIYDYTGKIFTLGKVQNPFMGQGHVFFPAGSLIIRIK